MIAPHFQLDLKEDIGSSKFSLLIDESTDIAVINYLGTVIIYFSHHLNKIITTFLDLVPLINCDTDGIITAIKEALNKYHLDIQKLLRLGTDNAAVMTGINAGVYTKLKSEVRHLRLIKCVCHSLQLAVSHAAKEALPRHLEFIIDETYN